MTSRVVNPTDDPGQLVGECCLARRGAAVNRDAGRMVHLDVEDPLEPALSTRRLAGS